MNRKIALALGWVVIGTSVGFAQPQQVKVTTDGGSFTPGSQIPISVGLLRLGDKPPRLPRGYTNPTAFYWACTANNERDTWNTGLGAEAFCDLAGKQTKLFTGKPESVQDVAGGSSARHTFAEKLTLPQQPVGTKLWVITRLDYGVPGLAAGEHKSLYGWLNLLYVCDQPGGAGKTTKVTCGYYTPAGLAIRRGATKVPGNPPKPPG